MEQTEKTYLLDIEVVVTATDIEEAQEAAEKIISAMPSDPSVAFLGGNLSVGRQDKPVEFVRFGSDRPYQNSLALHPERESTTA